MQDPPEEGEDVFFDSLDYLSASFRFMPSEDVSTSIQGIGFETFGRQVWTRELRSVRERRESFLHRMGFSEFLSSESQSSRGNRQVCSFGSSQRSELDRTAEDKIAVLDSSASGSDIKDENVDSVSEPVGKSFEPAQDSQPSTSQKETYSTGGMRCDMFGISRGLSHSVQQLVPKEGRPGERISSRQRTYKRGWWKGLLGGQYGELTKRSLSLYVEEHKTGTTKIQQYGKPSCTEFTALHVDQEFQAHKGAIWAMAFSPDGRYLATGGEDCVVRVWLVVEVETSRRVLRAHLDRVKEFKWIPKGRCSDSGVVVTRRKTFKLEETPLHEFRGHTSDVLAISWSAESKCLLTSSKDKTARLWQVGLDHCLGVFRHNDYVTCIQFNPADDGYFISGSIDGKVRIWRISESRVVGWADIREIITAVCFRPNGQGFVVGSITGQCRFYDQSENGLQLDTELNIQGKKKAYGKRITGFQFTPDDPERLMITSADSKMRIVHGNAVIHRYGGHRKSKNQLTASFTSDGKYIVSTGEDSRVYIWKYSGALPSKATRSTRSCEYFLSKDATIALPWPAMDKSRPGPNLQTRRVVVPRACAWESERSCLGSWLFADCSTGASATWPEEKLGPWGEGATGATGVSPRGGHRYHQNALKLLTPTARGRVIVTAGHDGIIRSFHDHGLAIKV